MQGSSQSATSALPQDKVLARAEVDIYADATADTDLSSASVSPVGGSQSHTNLQPFLAVHFIVALVGVYPSRN
jgi:microcystin-dependent protein